jgi:hypothetical protein
MGCKAMAQDMHRDRLADPAMVPRRPAGCLQRRDADRIIGIAPWEQLTAGTGQTPIST